MKQNMTLNRIPGLAYNVLQLNPSRTPMDNEKVRQAISCAVNRQEMIDTALVGEGKVTGPLTMPAFADDPSTLFCYKQDVDKAKALMKEAGQEAGFSVDVIAATGEPPYAANEAQVLQSQLAAIGIKLNIKMMELKPYVDTWLKGDFDMAVAQNGGRPDPYPMYNRYFTKAGNLPKVSQLHRRHARQPAAAGPRRDRPGQAQADLPAVRAAPRRSCRPGSGSPPTTPTRPTSTP